ncbi:endo-1,3-beta-glucanase Engl1 [Linnemannia elongata]|nr:endo-1,3-beta-glucanase Engl1 [Linnemannia elongata]
MGVDFSTGPLDPSDPFSSLLGRDQLVAQIDRSSIIPTPIPHSATIFDVFDGDDQIKGNSTDETVDAEHYERDWSRPDSVLTPISTEPPLPLFKQREHPVKPMRVRVTDQSNPQPTNKFYGNLMLGDSHAPIWTHPYGLRWDRMGKTQHGLSISHIDDSSKAFGPPEVKIAASGSGERPSKYYLNPFLVSLGMSATELDEQHEMTVGDFSEFSCAVELTPASERALERQDPPASVLRVPVVRGMVFISALYKDLTPQFYSNILIRTLTLDPQPMADGWVKYRFLIENGVTWLLYAKPDRSTDGPLRLEMRGQGLAVATSGKFTGLVQIAKLPVGKEDETERVYDLSMGVYPTEGELIVRHRYVYSRSGGYRIDWKLAGDTSKQFIHFTLPHHRQALTDKTKPTLLMMPSTTKGKMVAYTGSKWHLHEPDRLALDFLPDEWEKTVTPENLEVIRNQARRDIERDFDEETDLESMYFAGKGLAKFALLCLVVKDVLHETDEMQRRCLDKLENAFARFLENRQTFPLVYDKTWRGLVSVQGLTDHGALADFGNTWYNDHHYHYGYFIHAAAIIRHLDPNWRSDELVAYIDSLLRDVTNMSTNDNHFPRFRAFDWYMGHSWSQGIFVSLDGKDEESTSEDINLYYGMSLWGRVNNRPDMDNMGAMMLTIARRSIQAYFLMDDDNMNHPRAFVGNKVTGILFENKVDHTTYFSPRLATLECIQGIQMIPATPALPLIRSEKFVRQEWESVLRSRAEEIDDGWKSILMMNYATLDKAGAWKYFAESEQPVQLDDGMTLTWAMFYVASLQPS